ncbi:MAG TPA: GtrA family protein [Puia sp.]|nr:GtrA family protein [Puia sp.]
MITFTKAQIASILATAVDFAVTYALLRFIGGMIIGGIVAGGVICGGMGTVCGGITHFLVSRSWVFQAQEGKWATQLNRYVLVWTGNLLLNISGLWFLIHAGGVKAMLAKVIVAVTVAIAYNYILQKRFVFK